MGLEEDIGTIRVGKLADLLVVEGDPLRDIGVLRDKARIKLVMKGCQAFVDRLPATRPVRR